MKRRLALCALALLGLAACQPDKPNFKLIDVTGANYARDFTLTDMNGQTRALSSLKGKLTVVFFGYTQCPDVCPTTLSEIVQIKQALGADGEKIQAVFVTVDPARDTPEVLKEYAQRYQASEGWQFLTGDEAQISHLRMKLGLYSPADGTELEDHGLVGRVDRHCVPEPSVAEDLLAPFAALAPVVHDVIGQHRAQLFDGQGKVAAAPTGLCNQCAGARRHL